RILVDLPCSNPTSPKLVNPCFLSGSCQKPREQYPEGSKRAVDINYRFCRKRGLFDCDADVLQHFWFVDFASVLAHFKMCRSACGITKSATCYGSTQGRRRIKCLQGRVRHQRTFGKSGRRKCRLATRSWCIAGEDRRYITRSG